MRALLTLGAGAVLLAGCTLQDLGFGASRQAVFGAATTLELADLGAVRLDSIALASTFSGGTFVEPNEDWIWEINADGTHHARAGDNSWADAPGGQWDIADDTFCRENEDLERKCSEVWQIGPYYRFTEPDGQLAVWTITQS